MPSVYLQNGLLLALKFIGSRNNIALVRLTLRGGGRGLEKVSYYCTFCDKKGIDGSPNHNS